ncbi:MAG: acyl-phosphate glycerol-3-phosphate acyltransferase [Bacteroidetes bacterium]|nr:acyl-phosphate glycerol-3-phosphate acyltransferase [Bacteroidota bacterium]MDF2451127.1 acyl-phosphate glycerol-3-phosphate acyltransferase [Bacteroidota bacterium]
METIVIISLLVAAYLLGSIPTAVWWGKRYYGIDVREFGSGNAGATNTFRVLGKKAGIPVLIVDIVKGTVAVLLAHLSPYVFDSNEFVNLELGLGIAALVGHVFPIFAGFRGGKGVATILGIVICLTPFTSLMVLGVFLIVLLATRYVSLSSMTAGLSFPFFLNVVLKNQNETLLIFSLFVAILLIITHKKNISRLLKRQESKVNLFAKKV